MANETFWMNSVGGLQNANSFQMDAFGATEVDRGWRVETDTRVAVLVVVPPEEALAENAAIFNRTETVRELWPVFEGLELRL